MTIFRTKQEHKLQNNKYGRKKGNTFFVFHLIYFIVCFLLSLTISLSYRVKFKKPTLLYTERIQIKTEIRIWVQK